MRTDLHSSEDRPGLEGAVQTRNSVWRGKKGL